MLQSAYRALTNAELRRKLLITVSLIALYRVGSEIPAPGISARAVRACTGLADHAGLLSVLNLFSGGALSQLTLLALGVMPYITASIMSQLLTSVVPAWAALRRDGGPGQAKLTQYTRYLTTVLALVQTVGLTYVVRGNLMFRGCMLPVMPHPSLLSEAGFTMAVMSGTLFVMFLGEKITEFGIGNGMSLLMLSTIAAQLPVQFHALTASRGPVVLGGALLLVVTFIAAVVFVEQAQRRVPVTYSDKIAATTQAAQRTTFFPVKVNQAGVVPAIFASTLLSAPTLVAKITGGTGGFSLWVNRYLASGAHPVYVACYVLLIVFFSFFYVFTTYNVDEHAEDLRDAGAFIPGVRPGPATAAYLDRVLTRLTVAGAGYLSIVAVMPLLLLSLSGGVNSLPLGGTSLLILVGVGLETVKQLTAAVQQKTYPGFLLTADKPVAYRPRHLLKESS